MSKIKNLLYIFPDQMGANVTGFYGNKYIKTPNIDALAKQSTVFTRAYSTSPVCTPYRGCLFTGRYPIQTGIVRNQMRIPDDEITLAKCMNASIYTAYVGKWHLSGKPDGNRWVPPKDRGDFIDFTGWESHHVDHWDGKIWRDNPDKVIEMPGHESTSLTDIACDKLRELKDKDRFCMFVAFQSPHPPCSPPNEYLDIYKDTEICFSPNVPKSAPYYIRPAWNSNYNHRTFVNNYYAEITHIDDCVGRLINTLEELGLTDSTAIVFTSDHGEMMGSHGLYSKGKMYEESSKIPLILKIPNANSQINNNLISTVDLMPTLLDLMDIPIPNTVEGVSHIESIKNNMNLDNSIFLQNEDLAVIEGDYKLITDLKAQTSIALYNLSDDPYEMSNLINNVNYYEIVDIYLIKLQKWLADISTRIGNTDDADALAHYYR